MATRYIEIVNGTSDARYPQHRDGALAAGIFVDSSASSQLKFDQGGTDQTVVDLSTSQILAKKQVQGIAPLSITTATLALTVAAHDGIIIRLDRAAGVAVTLPAATGSGACFRIFVGTTLTGTSITFAVASASDYMRGQAWTIGAANAGFLTANTGTVSTESDTITWNKGTTGLGTQGDYVEFVDIAANVWAVEVDYASSGTAATPFSAAV